MCVCAYIYFGEQTFFTMILIIFCFICFGVRLYGCVCLFSFRYIAIVAWFLFRFNDWNFASLMWRQVKVHNVLSSTTNICVFVCVWIKKIHMLHWMQSNKSRKKHSQMSAVAVVAAAAAGCYQFFSSFLYCFMHINWYVHAAAVNYYLRSSLSLSLSLSLVNVLSLLYTYKRFVLSVILPACTHTSWHTESKMLSMVLLFFCLSPFPNWIMPFFVM